MGTFARGRRRRICGHLFCLALSAGDAITSCDRVTAVLTSNLRFCVRATTTHDGRWCSHLRCCRDGASTAADDDSGDVGGVVRAVPCPGWVGKARAADDHGRADGLHRLQGRVTRTGRGLGAGDFTRRPRSRTVVRDAGVWRHADARTDSRHSSATCARSVASADGRAET